MVHVGHEGVSKIEPAFDESTIYCLHQYFHVCNLRVVSHLFLEIDISCNRKKTYGLFIKKVSFVIIKIFAAIYLTLIVKINRLINK